MSSEAEPRLSDIAGAAGYGAADVALLSGLDESTVCRMWDDPDWLDRVRGRSLQALIAALPGVAEQVAGLPLRARRTRLVQTCAGEGLAVDEAALDRLAGGGMPEQYLCAALEAAVHVLRRDVRRTVELLPRFWGQTQDAALGALFAPAGTGLLADPDTLLSAATALAPRLARPAYSWHAILARAHLLHHTAKASGGLPADLDGGVGPDRQSAFTLRSTVMGALGRADDLAAAERYRRLVAKHPALKMIEEWSFPTWTRDCRPTPDFSLPRSLLLVRTAGEVLHELGDCNDAYSSYLATTYLPLALERDPTFGLRARDLRDALARRREGLEDRATRREFDVLLGQLEEAPAP